MSRKRSSIICYLIGVISVVNTSAGAALQAQQRPPIIRPFADGPLTAEDFRAKQPDSELDAYTHTNTQFKYGYVFKSLGDVTTAELTGIDVFGVVERDKSWNKQIENKSLLDHEQGHFEVTHMFATKVKIEILKQIKSGTPLKAAGSDEQDAVRKLEDKIKEILDLYKEQALRTHREYDRVTQHGLLPDPQREQRQEQISELKRLADEVKRIGSH